MLCIYVIGFINVGLYYFMGIWSFLIGFKRRRVEDRIYNLKKIRIMRLLFLEEFIV